MGDFREVLLVRGRERPLEENVFIRRLCRGDYSCEELRAYARRICQLADGFPRQLAAILSICPENDIRPHLLENLIEEEGIVPSADGRGFVHDAQRKHSELARRFTRALGISDASLLSSNSSVSSRWFDRTLAEGHWLAAVAYVTVGFESNVPRTFRLIVPVLRASYGFNDHELSFFIEHIEADEGHGALGADIIARSARTSTDREEALEGVHRGVSAWWWFHQACDKEIRRNYECAQPQMLLR